MIATVPEIAAALIVRDETANIVRCLDAAKAIATRLLVMDTGSEDGTPELVERWTAENGLPLELHNEPWENFAVNRTSLMRHGRENGADWLLLLDADLVLHAPDPLPDMEGADAWFGRINGSLDYALPFLVRASKPWFYEGVAHSYLACTEDFNEAVMDGLAVDDYSHTTREKLERDLEALSLDLARNPTGSRTAYYLAQTYQDLDMIPEAIQTYRLRAGMGGYAEETYYARYRLGCLLCEHVGFTEGARELLAAWEARPSRAEALRALAGAATNVANKIAYPDDRLFVGRSAYQPHDVPVPSEAAPVEVAATFSAAPPGHVVGTPRQHAHKADTRKRQRRLLRSRDITRPLTYDDVTAVLVTRGNVDMAPIIDPLPFNDVVVWDNSRRPEDLGPFGRYAAIREARNPVIYWQDDDVLFDRFDDLLAAYRPGMCVTNMDAAWVEGAGYGDFVSMQGAGSLCDAWLPERVFAEYREHHPDDDDFLIEADFVFGCLVPFARVDVGYRTREFTDDADRLYTQVWQQSKKREAIERCRAIVAARAAA